MSRKNKQRLVRGKSLSPWSPLLYFHLHHNFPLRRSFTPFPLSEWLEQPTSSLHFVFLSIPLAILQPLGDCFPPYCTMDTAYFSKLFCDDRSTLYLITGLDLRLVMLIQQSFHMMLINRSINRLSNSYVVLQIPGNIFLFSLLKSPGCD